ncbi:hypothetical protein HY250_00650 [Candidatus Azambacteria bacterium]|nr:hypothetical protein [Candidatus Azambacteria bacterium]
MNTKRLFIFLALGFFAAPIVAFASSPFDITFPIPELGNCADNAACKAYCDDSANNNACVAFAELHGIKIDKENDVQARAKLIREQGGPGGCQSDGDCRAYCEDPAHQDECIAFAEAHGFMSKDQAERAKRFSRIAREGGPGGCKGEEECRAFCEDPDHFKECVAFAEKQGFIDPEEAQRIKRLPPVGPGGCKGAECKTYCDDPAHQEECIAFAEQNGLIGKDEAERAKKFAGKPGPGGCRGEACRTYCADPAHHEECVNFAIENGFMSKDEGERAKKFSRIAQQGGPGGCKGEGCKAYCEDPAHQEECFQFAKEHKLVSEDELHMMERGRELSKKVKEAGGPGGCTSDKECQEYCKNPEHVDECLAFAVEHGGFKKEDAQRMLKEFVRGANRSGPEGFGGSGDDAKRFEQEHLDRFEEFRTLEGQFRRPEGASLGGFMEGPGGCKGPEECIKFCSDPVHRDECAKFNLSIGVPPPGEMFRQGEPGSEGGYQGKLEGLRTCGPQPGMPTPQGCTGPVCKEGRWEFICPQGERRMPPSPDGSYQPGALPPSGAVPYLPISGTENREGIVCTQEFRPVCGENKRTYPNACYAKRDNVAITKEGPCESFGITPPQTGTYPSPYQQPMYQKEQVPAPSGVFPPPPFASVLGSFLKLFLLK